MLTKVEIRSSSGEVLNLPLTASEEGFSVTDIQGLDPVLAVLVSSSFAKLDGEQYQSSRREKRNILLTLAFELDYSRYTIQSLRTRLYRFLMPKSKIRMRFFSDINPYVDIEGYVESLDASIFTKTPTASASIICFNPDFEAPLVQRVDSFSVSNETETFIDYDGTVDTGAIFTLQIDRILSEFTIFNRAPDGTTRVLEFAQPLQPGDVVKISTTPGDKYVTLTRGGVDSSILFGLSPDSDWIRLYPGRNRIRVYLEGAPIAYSVEYTNKYGGL